VEINQDRLWSSLADLGEIGAYDDERTGLRGVNRMALTDADRDGRELVCRWFRDAGLELRVDQIGNVFGRRHGTEAGAAAVLLGSHIDSVATAGRFDGCLGVLGALEVVRCLNDAGITTRRPIDVAFFSEEEGVRFGTDMLGSAVRAGRIELDDALSHRDEAGRSVADELDRIGYAGEHPVRDEPPYAYLECHIEQGPVLAAAGVDLGVARHMPERRRCTCAPTPALPLRGCRLRCTRWWTRTCPASCGSRWGDCRRSRD
jgi:N-carbamoyl-L-amino-acid hydrolase